MDWSSKTIAKITVVERDFNLRSYEYWCQNEDEINATIQYLARYAGQIDVIIERAEDQDPTNYAAIMEEPPVGESS